jgi:hypothetical protein
VDHPDVVALKLQARGGQAVVEAGCELDRDLDLAGLAAGQPQQLVVAAGLGRVARCRSTPDGQAVDHGQDAAWGEVAGLQDVGGGQVAAADGEGPVGAMRKWPPPDQSSRREKTGRASKR